MKKQQIDGKTESHECHACTEPQQPALKKLAVFFFRHCLCGRCIVLFLHFGSALCLFVVEIRIHCKNV